MHPRVVTEKRISPCLSLDKMYIHGCFIRGDDGLLLSLSNFIYVAQFLFKRRLVAFKGGFVGPSVGPSVGRSVGRSVGLSSKIFSKSFEKEVLSIK